MQVVSAPAGTAVWMCPECGHGSPDPRDEAAHLDAHRQLRAFLDEWDGAPARRTARRRRSRRRLALLYGMVAVLFLLGTIGVFSRVNRAPDAFQPRVLPQPERTVEAPPSPPTTVRPAPVAPTPPTTPPTTVVRRAPAPALAPAPAGDAPLAATPATTIPVPAPAPGPAAPEPPTVAPVPPMHLLEICLLGICLTVL